MKAHFRIPPENLLRLHGDDVADLLHRIAATELRDLESGSSRRILFCDDKGRVVDLPLARVEGDAWWLLANEGNATMLRAWIERYVITEDLRFDRVVASPWTLELDGVQERLVDNSVAPALEPLRPELHWIRAGLYRPAHAGELKLHPLECGLRAHVSFTKGCYIGQEVVARMESYEKVQRGLYRIEAPGEAPRTPAAIEDGIGRVLMAAAVGDGYLGLCQLPLDGEYVEELAVEGAEPGRVRRIPDPAD